MSYTAWLAHLNGRVAYVTLWLRWPGQILPGPTKHRMSVPNRQSTTVPDSNHAESASSCQV